MEGLCYSIHIYIYITFFTRNMGDLFYIKHWQAL